MMKDHVIILGWDGFSERIFRELNRSDVPVAVATEDKRTAIEDRYGHVDDLEVLEVSSFDAVGELAELDAAEAAQFFINVEFDDEKLLRVVDLKERPNWNGEIDVVLENEQLKETFEDAGVRYAVSRRDISSRLLASHIYEPAVAQISEQLFTATENGDIDSVDFAANSSTHRTDAASDYEIQELKVGRDCALVDEASDSSARFGNFMAELRSNFGAMPLAFLDNETDELMRLPSPDSSVQPGDYLLVALSRDRETAIHAFLDSSEEGRMAE